MRGLARHFQPPASSSITTRVLTGFDDPSFTEEQWTQLLQTGDTDSVNLTWRWQRSWWNTFKRGQLILIVAERDGHSLALAPLFAHGGMIFNLCPEDGLDFVGDISDASVLDALLVTARSAVDDILGFRFYFIPDTSRTAELLRLSATRLGLTFHDEGNLPSPFLDLSGDLGFKATRKKSLLRHENYFRREGGMEILHLQKGADILPHLEDFFDQHVARRAATSHQSLFVDPKQRAYYRQFTQEVSSTGWLRFTRINWNGHPIAFHYGLSYRGRYLFGIPSFAIELARHSPGEVLLRQLLLAAIDEGASTFDFGIGDESYKYRFATNVIRLHTWGLYPKKR